MSFIISVQHLTKVYAQEDPSVSTKALDDITLAVEEGDFVAVAGPSGSGKTTFLNILGCLDKPTGGEVVIDGTALSSLNSGRLAEFRLKKIGFVFQSYNLINTLTVLENTEYVMLLQNVPRKRRRREAIQTLKDLGLESMINRKPSELSVGQQQRVAIARAILAQPRIILADEPTADLDSKTGADLIDLMRLMNKNLKITFLFTTHDKMVMEKAKTLIQMRDGKCVP